MTQIEDPMCRSQRAVAGATPRDVEHLIIDEGQSSECVLVPGAGDEDALATQWISAEAGSYTALDEMR